MCHPSKTNVETRLKTLDLANITDWLSETENIVHSLIPERVRNDLRSFDPDEMYDDAMSFLVESCLKHGEYRNGACIEVSDWSSAFETAFLKRYSHIRAFHACRAFSGIEPYQKYGIQKLSRDLLRELAHRVFSRHSTATKINAAVDAIDIPQFEQSVYLFTDSLHPLDKSSNHYLQSGSEMLQALSIELGIHSIGILASQGVPYMIECEVPLPNVAKEFRWELWRTFVTRYFQIAAGFPRPEKPFDFSIRVTQSISPGAIKQFHRVHGTIRSSAPWH